MRTRILAGLSAAMLAAGLGAAPSSASTGGTEDIANEYAAVAFVAVSYPDGGISSCSATLISETVLLTAAHCVAGVPGNVAVSFEQAIATEPPADGSLPFPRAAVPGGYEAGDLAGSSFVLGTPHAHPAFDGFADLKTLNDVGVIVLESASAVTPMHLASVGTLDDIAQSDLRTTPFRAVGYGANVRKPDEGPQRPTPMNYPLVRRYVDMPGQKLTDQVLQTNGNEKDPFFDGGTCFGDSGGPVLLDGEIVAVTSYGYTSNCRYIAGYQRVDIGATRGFIDGFLS